MVEAFADAWGFPAAAMLTVLNADGSQSAVPASELSVGSQARTCSPLVQIKSSCALPQPLHACSMTAAEQMQTRILRAQHTEYGDMVEQVLSACGSNSSLCWDTVYLLVRTFNPAAARGSALAVALPCHR